MYSYVFKLSIFEIITIVMFDSGLLTSNKVFGQNQCENSEGLSKPIF